MKVSFAGVPVGPEHPPVLCPDIGTFFGQDMDLAHYLVDRLVDGGARFIKGEILHRADVCLDDDFMVSYNGLGNGVIRERYRQLIERKVVSLDAYEGLFQHCLDRGADFLVSVYDMEGARFAKDVGACAIKIASSNIVHEPLIRYTASLGLPMIIDTGKSTIEEMARAVQWARDAGAVGLVVEHSPLAPPAPVSQQNIRMLPTLAKVFDCPVGLSDHYSGEEMMYAAVALGASLIEKGVCNDDAMMDQDIAHALPVGRFAEVREKCERIHVGLGSETRQLLTDRKGHPARMGLIARKDITAGAIISLKSVDFAWPAKGIPVEHWSVVAGGRLTEDVKKGMPLQWSQVRFSSQEKAE